MSEKFSVTVIGAGRLGTALAVRSLARGYPTRVIVRNSPVCSTISGHELAEVRHISEVVHRDRDNLVVLAAPAMQEPSSEETITNFLSEVPRDCLVASAVAYGNAPHSVWGKGRRYIRFLATPAAAVADAPAILLVDADEAECVELLTWFGPAQVGSGGGKRFIRQSHMLMATPLLLGVLSHVIGSDGGDDEIAVATLRETQTLIATSSGNLEEAIDLCATPNGLTRKLLSKFAAQLIELDSETGNDGRL